MTRHIQDISGQQELFHRAFITSKNDIKFVALYSNILNTFEEIEVQSKVSGMQKLDIVLLYDVTWRHTMSRMVTYRR